MLKIMETKEIIERANKAVTEAFNNGSEFERKRLIEKSVNYFTPILKTYCSDECAKELIDGFVNSLEE